MVLYTVERILLSDEVRNFEMTLSWMIPAKEEVRRVRYEESAAAAGFGQGGGHESGTAGGFGSWERQGFSLI